MEGGRQTKPRLLVSDFAPMAICAGALLVLGVRIPVLFVNLLHKAMAVLICADFLAGANLENGDADVLLMSLRRWFGSLTCSQQQEFLHEVKQSG